MGTIRGVFENTGTFPDLARDDLDVQRSRIQKQMTGSSDANPRYLQRTWNAFEPLQNAESTRKKFILQNNLPPCLKIGDFRSTRLTLSPFWSGSTRLR